MLFDDLFLAADENALRLVAGVVMRVTLGLLELADKVALVVVAGVRVLMAFGLLEPADQRAGLLLAGVVVYVQLSLLERAYQVAVSVVAVSIMRVCAEAIVLAVQYRLLVGHGVAPLAQQACHTNGNHQRQARQDGGIARMSLVRQQQFGNMLSDGASHYALPPSMSSRSVATLMSAIYVLRWFSVVLWSFVLARSGATPSLPYVMGPKLVSGHARMSSLPTTMSSLTHPSAELRLSKLVERWSPITKIFPSGTW